MSSEIEKFILENRIDTVEYGFGDINGVLRGKRHPARYFLKDPEAGTALAKAPFAWDIQCGVYEDVEVANFGNGFPDMFIKPVFSTLRKVPWREGSAFVLCDAFDEDGAPLKYSPREVLKNVLKKADSLGYRPLVGSELEFYLLDKDKKPLFDGIQCYSLYRGAELEYILKDMRNGLEEFGIPIEAFHIEYGPAQIEVIPEYGDALEMADNTVLLKNAIKEIARSHGVYATFMPKPWENESGSGYHVHQSLWNKELTVNYFETDATLANHYQAGLVHTTRDFMVLGSPSVNSYKRFKEQSFAPTVANWGKDNRTVATRSLLGLGKGSRFEHRTGSADANPYLIIASSIASGIYGIEHELTLPEVSGAIRENGSSRHMPRNLSQALDLFERNPIAAELFGDKFVKLFLTLGRHEAAQYDTVVTDWEWNRYFEMA